MEHFTNDRPVVISTGTAPVAAASGDTDVEKQIRELIEVKVRPAVAQDGGDIVFETFEDGIVYLTLKGSCSGCPSSTHDAESGHRKYAQALYPRSARSAASRITCMFIATQELAGCLPSRWRFLIFRGAARQLLNCDSAC